VAFCNEKNLLNHFQSGFRPGHTVRFLILTNPLGEWRHLVKKFKNVFHYFIPFSTQTRCKKPNEKINH
jgi:hypothetical protein